jgi:lysine 2,3-aminomutase
MYCRFCTRKRATMKRGGWDAVSRDDRRMVEYVRDHPEIRDVIVSGGDPLTLPLEKLAFFLEHLAAIPHVDVIRIGTRVPVTLPQRLDDDEMIGILAATDKVWIQTHFNHAREVTPEARRACDRLRRAGMPINNHAVLLKGVNDSLSAQRELCRALLRIKVRPYYLFHCDPVTGAGHFRTSLWKGLEIIEGLRGHMSGLGIPTYVVDAPRGGGKIPIMPNYIVSASDDAVALRNYEGMIVRYHPTGAPNAPPDPAASQGVSALLSGGVEALIPEGNPRHRRRKPSPLKILGPSVGQDGAKVNGNGKVDGLTNGNGQAKVNGNGRKKRGSAP